MNQSDQLSLLSQTIQNRAPQRADREWQSEHCDILASLFETAG